MPANFGYVIGNGSGPVQILVIDAVLSENPTRPADMTKHPAEEGSDFSDSFNVGSQVIQLEAVIAEYQPGGQVGRASQARKTLEQIQKTGTLVTYSSGRSTLRNCGISNLSFMFDAKDGQNLHFTCQLTELRIVQTSTVNIQKKRVADVKVKPKNPKGGQATEEIKSTLFLGGEKTGLIKEGAAPMNGRGYITGGN